MTAWHCVNLEEGRIRLMLYFNFGKTRVLSVPLIGSSSNWRTQLDTRLSMFSVTQVLHRSAIGKFHYLFCVRRKR